MAKQKPKFHGPITWSGKVYTPKELAKHFITGSMSAFWADYLGDDGRVYNLTTKEIAVLEKFYFEYEAMIQNFLNHRK